MTRSGTFSKISYLLAMLGVGAVLGWLIFSTPYASIAAAGGLIVGLVCALASVFAPQYVPYAAMPYAFAQGLTLSIMARTFELVYPGIAISAVSLTGATAIAMLLLYRLEIIRVTDTFRSVIITATAAIGVTYLLVGLFWLAGIHITPFYENASLLSVGFSLFVVGVAACNLLLNFDLIEQGAEHNLPKFMEWYAAFSLLVTLIWLYLEILRLLLKLSRRR
jgi:uncharacterized YccA/Bax inhibitor family protein